MLPEPLLENQCRGLRLDPQTSASCRLGQAGPASQTPFGQDTPPRGLSPNLVLAGALEKCCELTGQVLEVAQARQAECPSTAPAQAPVPKRILPFWALQNLWL